jgi:deazaflavin-dependent oxidoreductase (nitroreductase family)
MPLPRSVARFNRRYWNKVSRYFAGWLPGFGIVIHTGRNSGRTYETPINVFRTEDGFVVALTYGRADWVRNVLAAGGAKVRTRRKVHTITNPRIVAAPAHARLPYLPRKVLAVLDVPEELHLDDVRSTL